MLLLVLLQDSRRTHQIREGSQLQLGTDACTLCLDRAFARSQLGRELLVEPIVHGDRASALLQAHRELETGSWRLVEGILDFDQITQLQAIVKEWRALHPTVKAVAQIRFADFAEANKPTAGANEHGKANLFSLIGLDPFRSIDPAVREIEQTRVLAERSIFYLQRAPNLLDMVPAYEGDPEQPKVVARDAWFTAPASEQVMLKQAANFQNITVAKASAPP